MANSLFNKLIKPFIPAPLLHVIRRAGILSTARMLIMIGAGYTETILYLLRKRGVKAAWTFISVKLFTPVGPGGAGFFWFLLGWFIRRHPNLYRFPRQLELEISTKCTKKCIHCENTHWKDDTQPREYMPRKDVLNILDQFPNLRWVSLVGEGSSFEHPDMLEFIRHVKKREIMCYMVDHMSDWTDDTFKAVFENDMDGISISLDAGTKKTYEALKHGCEFDKVKANIMRLVEEKKKRNTPLPEIMFTFIAMKRNVHEIPDYVNLIAEMGTRKFYGAGSRIGVVRLLAFKQILHLQLEDIPQDIIDRAYENARKNDLFINFTGTNVREDLPGPDCCMAWMEPYIFMGGYISQCCAVFISNNRNFIRKHSLGNVFEKDFKDHWKGKAYKTLRNTITKEDQPIPIQCAGCRVFNTLPREKKYGIRDTHTGEIYSLKTFYEEHMGENMKWRYEDIIDGLP